MFLFDKELNFYEVGVGLVWVFFCWCLLGVFGGIMFLYVGIFKLGFYFFITVSGSGDTEGRVFIFIYIWIM